MKNFLEKCLTRKLGSVIIILQIKLGKRGLKMEEQENSVETKEVEEKTTALTKEEILAKSREENKNGDEMQKSGEKWAARIAVSVCAIVACLVMGLSMIFDVEVPLALYIVIGSLMAAYVIFLGIKGNKFRKFMLVGGIIMAICVVILIVVWILELCGVAL